MDAIECLYSRVSTRDFNDRPVSEDDLAKILDAAAAAPVGMCRYPDKHLTVVKNAAFLKAVTAKSPQGVAFLRSAYARRRFVQNVRCSRHRVRRRGVHSLRDGARGARLRHCQRLSLGISENGTRRQRAARRALSARGLLPCFGSGSRIYRRGA